MATYRYYTCIGRRKNIMYSGPIVILYILLFVVCGGDYDDKETKID